MDFAAAGPKRRLKLAFSDFWDGFDPRVNYFTELLGARYAIEVSSRPDLLIYSCFGRRFLDYSCPRVCYIGEPRRPNFFECDYALSFDAHLSRGGRNYRLPHYVLYDSPTVLVRGPDYDPGRILARKSGFCSFVFRRHELSGHDHRVRFFEKLSKYKRVDAGGSLLNNVGGPVADKLAFVSRRKFDIAFENTRQRGYVTEKIFDAFRAGTVPIYWGHEDVADDFDPASFVDAGRFASLDDAVDAVVQLDRDEERYLQMLAAPPLHGNRAQESLLAASILDWFDGIISRPKPVRGNAALGLALTAMRKTRREALALLRRATR